MAVAETGGVRIGYELAGERDGPVVVLSNSLGVDRSMWERQAEALKGRFRLLRYDTRGHGESSTPEGPYRIEELGRDVLGLLDLLEMERVSFCGISMGGVVGQWLAIHAAGRLDKLVLASTAAKIGSDESWNARIAMVMAKGMEPVILGTLERWFTPVFRERNRAEVAATGAMLSRMRPEGYLACCAAVRDADFRGELGAIGAPTLVISGSGDPVTPPADGHFLAAGIGGARYVELEAAHLCSVEAAEAFNAAVLDFLVA